MTTSVPASRDPFAAAAAAAAAAVSAAAASCGGDGCDAVDPWPLYHVRHRTVFCRLCASCVLRYHHGSFCSHCLDLLDSAPPPPSPESRRLVRCSDCPAVSHLGCLPESSLTAAASPYLCPSCTDPDGFSYFRPVNGSRTVDLPSAKALLAAARLAASSMSRAAAAARADAERKGKESALARKRAREMLERAVSISRKERERERERERTGSTTKAAEVGTVSEPKKKKKVPDWQREKLMKLSSGPVQMPVANHVKLEEREKGFKGVTLNPSAGVKEDKVLKLEADKAPKLSESTQDIKGEAVSRTNSGALFKGSQKNTNLHS